MNKSTSKADGFGIVALGLVLTWVWLGIGWAQVGGEAWSMMHYFFITHNDFRAIVNFHNHYFWLYSWLLSFSTRWTRWLCIVPLSFFSPLFHDLRWIGKFIACSPVMEKFVKKILSYVRQCNESLFSIMMSFTFSVWCSGCSKLWRSSCHRWCSFTSSFPSLWA